MDAQFSVDEAMGSWKATVGESASDCELGGEKRRRLWGGKAPNYIAFRH